MMYRGLFFSFCVTMPFQRGGWLMHRRGRSVCALGIVSIVVGVLIILAMVLPSGFWWFILGAALIAVGLGLLRAF